MTRTRSFIVLALLPVLLGGCELDLGVAPFRCNKGEPKCPVGYHCEKDICVKDGVSRVDSAVFDQAVSQIDAGASDKLIPFPDGSKPLDKGVVSPDKAVVKFDLNIKPDLPQHPPDGGGHFGCQSNSECTNSGSPCCCPIPLIPFIWECLPLCINPFCI